MKEDIMKVEFTEIHFGTPTRPIQGCDRCNATWPHPPHDNNDGFHDGPDPVPDEDGD